MTEYLGGDQAVEQCVYPTGTCFTDAMDVLVTFLTEEQVPPGELRLVHGLCLLEDDNRLFAHAWVERGATCYFVGRLQGEKIIGAVPRQEYYRGLRVQTRTKYTPWQAARENQRTVSYGPWKALYLAHCQGQEAADGI